MAEDRPTANHFRKDSDRPFDAGVSKKMLDGAGPALANWSLALANVEALLPDRVTLRQVLFFSVVAQRVAMGQSITQAEIFGEYEGTLGRSLSKSAALFFEPSRTYPAGLGWLTHVEDKWDRRRKFIKLTDKGRAVANVIVQSVHEILQMKGV